MNRLIFTFIIVLGAIASLQAQTYNLHSVRTLEGHQLLEHQLQNTQVKTSAIAHRAPQQTLAVTDSLTFTSFGMSFFEGSTFVIDGGEFTKYKTTIVWYEDGTVRIDNLFNLHGHSNCRDEELSLWGTYSASDGLITIDTPEDPMTLVARLYGQVDGYLLAGEVGENYNFYPTESLQLRVSEDRLMVETLQHALILEEYSGTLATHTCYQYVKMYRACEGSKLVVFSPDPIEFATPLYPGSSHSKNIYLANVGSDKLDYALDVQAEGDNPFSMSLNSGSLRSMIMKQIRLTYAPQQIGQHQGQLSVSGGSTELTIPVVGQCIDYPDYSALVTDGDIEIHTCVEYPFALGYDGLDPVAYSTVGYNVGDSWLDAIVEVPAGQVGTLSWTGYTYNDYFMGSKGTVTVDGKEELFASYMDHQSIDGHCTLGEGRHTVRFNYNVSYPEFVINKSGLYLYSLGFTLEQQLPDAAWLPLGDQLPFGNYVVGQEPATRYVLLHNKGANPLQMLSADDAPHFHVTPAEVSAATLDTLRVAVVFDMPEAGTYDGTVTLHTTAGDFAVHCSALVRVVPDYSLIVAPDTDPTVPITWDYSTTYPFVIDTETLEAVNSNARELDSIANVAWMEASFTIPQGKVGVVSWDASLDIEDLHPDGSYHDYGMVFINHPSRQFGIIQIGHGDLSSKGCYSAWDSSEATAEYYTSGENYVRWSLSHFGDSYYEGRDEFRVRNFRIALEDFPEHAFQASTEYIDFGELLLGRTTSTTLQLTNMGGQVLTIDSVECDEPASLKFLPYWGAAYKVSFDLTFEFEGLWPGENEGSIIIYTNAGNLVLNYEAYVIDPKGYLMAEDFEGEMGWFRTDADGDGKGWNTLYNIYSTMSKGHCHSGEDGLGSSGYYYYLGDIDPDDWCYSPMVDIPAEGEYELSWWIGADDDDANYAHNYTVYVGEEMDRQTLTPMFTDQIQSPGWHHHSLNLKEWAGKRVCISFRHHDSKGLGIMKLDDVYIRPAQESAISLPRTDRILPRIYNLQGQPQSHLGSGINILCHPTEGRKVVWQ